MQRQLWIFLTASDEQLLLERLEKAGPFRRLPGRFFRGTDEDLRSHPESLETADAHAREHQTHIIPTSFEASLVVHDVLDGPFAGWRRLDETRSDVLTLSRPEPDAAGLAPARLATTAHAWFGGEKLRKSQDFTRWMGEAMREVETAWPPTQFEWLRIAPGAAEWAKNGGRLHYLFRTVALDALQVAATTQHRRV